MRWCNLHVASMDIDLLFVHLITIMQPPHLREEEFRTIFNFHLTKMYISQGQYLVLLALSALSAFQSEYNAFRGAGTYMQLHTCLLTPHRPRTYCSLERLLYASICSHEGSSKRW